MVDCGNIRCAQERRAFKKDLLSWTKKIPLAVGLETIAKEFASKDVMDKLLEPFNNLEPDTVKDWEPETTCHFCFSRLKFMIETVENGSSTEDESCNRTREDIGIRYLRELLPSACAPLFFPNIEQEDNQPLDLSATSQAAKSPGKYTEESAAVTKPPVELKVPQIKVNTRKKDTGRRTYTEEELSAAVDDIRSGKLGTRRAASLYGIPRSTLRNKIFKLEHNGNHGSTHRTDHFHSPPKSGHTTDEEEETCTLDPEETWQRKLELLRQKHNLNRHVLEWDQANKLTNPYANELKFPFFPDLVRKMAEDRMRSASANPELSSVLSMPETGANNSANVELKVPSYKPMFTNGDGEEPYGHSALTSAGSKIGETLKDIIAKTISEKLRSRLESSSSSQDMDPLVQYRQSQGALTDTDENTQEKLSEGPVAKKPRLSTNSSSHRGSLMPLKKTRPKRGQYRKYNSQLLMEAVRAVQRGEMSVHRAGSYFGVPHSTLEYKVKERHLLRQKKIQEAKRQAAATGSGNSKDSDSDSSPSKRASEVLSSFSAAPSTFQSSSLMNGGSMETYKYHGFSVNASATELLRKLQQKVQAKSTHLPQSESKSFK
ncbi:ligand-dependent nuclear receptor corepressor-like protein isoform X2 [Lingula anatina]|uniref:Ligand-dependent nuclear receptor corepressor-like protein isoform X2 n=1 Tax=Lingula anatina TaxID=7574 RepID=A0A1S3JQU3_LINAN|nr:ligand-dependent nuclear receptor corepressor-like protein isoform X2 [Lingula anatina]|eukprot:XP_013412727.1 ligand-dependent nuclear receptor corepressor-like protein isoform X2 [Lingula anatina]